MMNFSFSLYSGSVQAGIDSLLAFSVGGGTNLGPGLNLVSEILEKEIGGG